MAPACPWLRELEQELGARVLDEVRVLHILDRACERTGGYAPFRAKRRTVAHLGQCCLPTWDPLHHSPGLRALLPAYPASVGADGMIAWRGWHYVDHDLPVLSYFPRTAVRVRPSLHSEALIAVYGKHGILGCAVAAELRHQDGSYRPYWFPYPRLGE